MDRRGLNRAVLVVSAVVLIVGSGCHPQRWRYVAAGQATGDDDVAGIVYAIRIDGDLLVKVSATKEYGTIPMHLAVTNSDSDVLAVDTSLIGVSDRDGKPLERAFATAIRWADVEVTGVVELNVGDTCDWNIVFNTLDKPTRMRELYVHHHGLKRGERTIPVDILLRAEKLDEQQHERARRKSRREGILAP